jgi:hypothetical protein
MVNWMLLQLLEACSFLFWRLCQLYFLYVLIKVDVSLNVLIFPIVCAIGCVSLVSYWLL